MELRIHQIVVGFDFSDGATHALDAALNLARRVHASVRVVTAVPTGPQKWSIQGPHKAGGGHPIEIESMIIEEVERLSRERVALLEPRNVPIVYEVGEKRPDVLLREAADVSEAEIIVVGAVGQQGDYSFPIGTDTFRLIRNSVWPVMVIKRGSPFPPKRIVAAVDFSDASERALGWAVDLARLTDASLSVLHVLEGKSTEAEFAEWLENHDTSRIRKVRRVARRGQAHREILAQAVEDEADLLCIGSLGRTRLHELLIGGTSERVLRSLPCSAFFLKPTSFVLRG